MSKALLFQNTVPSLAEVSAKHVLSADYDTTRSEEEVDASRLFINGMAGLTSERSVDSWTVLPELDPLRRSFVPIIRFSESVHRNVTLFQICLHIPLS